MQLVKETIKPITILLLSITHIYMQSLSKKNNTRNMAHQVKIELIINNLIY